MTLAEYKANPEAWEPTFTVAGEADYAKWQDRLGGNDYERVLVSASLTAAAGVDLTYSQTKQVVFSEGVKLTLNLNELAGRCIYWQTLEDDDEKWLSGAALAVTNTFAANATYCFNNCGDVDAAEISGNIKEATHLYGFVGCGNVTNPSIGNVTAMTAAAGVVGGDFTSFVDCVSVVRPVIHNITTGTGGTSTAGGSFTGFQRCRDVVEPAITSVTTGAGGGNTGHGSSSGNGGDFTSFVDCVSVVRPVIHNITTGMSGKSTYGAAGGAFTGFQRCRDVVEPAITSVTTGAGGGSDNSYGGNGGNFTSFVDCDNVVRPVIHDITTGAAGNAGAAGGTRGVGGAFTGFQRCRGVSSPTITNVTSSGVVYGFDTCSNVIDPKGVLADVAGTSYLHYKWQGLITNRAGSNAKTALFSPAYGPYELLADLKPGTPAALSWRFITPAGEPVAKSAVLQVSTDNKATWTDIYTGANTEYSYPVPPDADNIRFRVYADVSSGIAYSEAYQFTVTPVISGTDVDLGELSTSFPPYQFAVSKALDDVDTWNAAFITAALDGETIQTFNAVVGDVKTLSIAPSVWGRVSNGAHTIKITATRIINGQPTGTSSVRTLILTRKQNKAVISLLSPAVAAVMPEQIEVAVGGQFPNGSVLTVEACNNADDPSPVWEDMTAESLAGEAHTFENSSKLALDWGVNIRVALDRGTAEFPCYINSIVGDFS
jgi:hypothetical protein